MTKAFLLAALAAIALAAGPATKGNIDEIAGTWRGKSICTPVRPACHDEIAVYHIAPAQKPDTILFTMNKVVDGEEVPMGGTLEYHVDYATRTLTYDMTARDGTKGFWKFNWTGSDMTGQLVQLPGREVVRNITLHHSDSR